MLGFTLVLLAAGFETTKNLLGNTVWLLDGHPAVRARLAADPSLIPGAIEESLRFESPVIGLARTTTRDVVVRGVLIPEGSRVQMNYASANRDDRAFVDADVFDIDRADQRHIAFGHGIHYCLGAALARLEAKVAMEELLARFPSYHVGDPERMASAYIRGFAVAAHRHGPLIGPRQGQLSNLSVLVPLCGNRGPQVGATQQPERVGSPLREPRPAELVAIQQPERLVPRYGNRGPQVGASNLSVLVPRYGNRGPQVASPYWRLAVLELGVRDLAAGVGLAGEAEDQLADDVALHLVGAAADVHGEAPSSASGQRPASGASSPTSIPPAAAMSTPRSATAVPSCAMASLRMEPSTPGMPPRASAVRTRALVRSNSRPRVNTRASCWRTSGSRRSARRPGEVDAGRRRRSTSRTERPGGEALVHQRGAGHPPAVVEVAHEVGGRDADVVEEHLVEVRLAGDLAQRSDRDARRAQVDDEARDALVLRHRRVGAEDAEPEVAVVGAAGPDLLAVEDELVAVALGPRAERGEVGAGVGLAPELAPDLLAAAHRAGGSGPSARRCRGR